MQLERDLFSWHSSATAGQRFGEAAEFRNHSPSGPHSTWCLQHQHGACPSARRPLQHLHGACPSTRRPHLAMREAVLHSHTGLRVSTNFKGGNFLIKWRFQRNVAFSYLASRDARRRAPRVPFGTTQEEFSFVFNMQVLLPALLPIDRVPARAPKFQITTTRKPDDGARRDFACTSS